MTLKQQLKQKLAGYEQDLRERALRERRQRDLDWEQWITTPEAIIDIIRDPRLAVRPSERIYSAKDILDRIMKGELP